MSRAWIAFVMTTLAASASAAPSFTLTDLGVATGFATGYGFSVNSLGQVAGTSAGAIRSATYFDHGLVTTLGPGGYSEAFGINSAGVIVGEVGVFGSTARPAIWTNGNLTYLAAPPGTVQGGAVAINSSGMAVGYTTTRGNGWEQATIFSNGGYSLVPHLPGAVGNEQSFSYGINDAGVVVGYEAGKATRYFNGVIEEIPDAGATWSRASAVANNGTIVGTGSGFSGVLAPWNDHGFILRGERIDVVDIGRWSDLRSVNSSNVAVGEFYPDVGPSSTWDGSLYRAFLWTPDEGAIDLNSLVVGRGQWVLHGAFGISENGYITGDMFKEDGTQHAFLLTPVAEPVPEPTSCVLMLSGLTALGWVARRRKRA